MAALIRSLSKDAAHSIAIGGFKAKTLAYLFLVRRAGEDEAMGKSTCLKAQMEGRLKIGRRCFSGCLDCANRPPPYANFASLSAP
jgi:hypothetical protein